MIWREETGRGRMRTWGRERGMEKEKENEVAWKGWSGVGGRESKRDEGGRDGTGLRGKGVEDGMGWTMSF